VVNKNNTIMNTKKITSFVSVPLAVVTWALYANGYYIPTIIFGVLTVIAGGYALFGKENT